MGRGTFPISLSVRGALGCDAGGGTARGLQQGMNQTALPELLQTLAARLAGVRVVDDAAAIAFVAAVVHGGRCPLCRRRGWRAVGVHDVDCDRCGVVSVYRRSALTRRRVPARALLGALVRLFDGTDATSAAGFARDVAVAHTTGWRLLHAVRAALPVANAADDVAVGQVLGREQVKNRAFVAVGVTAVGMVAAVVDVDAAPAALPDEALALAKRRAGTATRQKPSSAAALGLGLLRAWLTSTFRGVGAQWLWSYVREFNARQRRVSSRDLKRSACFLVDAATDHFTSQKQAA